MLKVQIKDTRSFDTAIRAVAKFSDKTRSTLPILANIHIKSIENGLRLTATDLDTAVSYALNSCEVSGDGEFLINVENLLGISKLAKEQVDANLTQTDSGVEVTFSDAETFKAIYYTPFAVDEFPALRTDQDVQHRFTLTADQVKQLKEVAKYVSKDKYRYGMDSLQFKSSDGVLTAYACDANSLASVQLQETADDIEFSIPMYCLRKAFQVASGDLAKTDWQISFAPNGLQRPRFCRDRKDPYHYLCW